MLGIHTGTAAEGWFGRGKKSAIASIAVIVVLVFGVVFGTYVAVNASGNNGGNQPSTPIPTTPIISQTPSTVTTEPAPTGVIEITAEQLTKESLANPEKYKKGTVFQVTGVLVWNAKLNSGENTLFFLGPAVYANDLKLGVRPRIPWEEKETIAAFRALNDGDLVVVKGTYTFFGKNGVLLENCSLISVTPTK